MQKYNLMECKKIMDNTLKINTTFKAGIKAQFELNNMVLKTLLEDIENKLNNSFTVEDFKNGLAMLDKVNNIEEDHKIVLVNFFVTKNFIYDIVIDRDTVKDSYKIKLARMDSVDFISSNNIFDFYNWDAAFNNFTLDTTINKIEDLKNEDFIKNTHKWIVDKIKWLMDDLIFTTIWSDL